jgi:hypothetical protein
VRLLLDESLPRQLARELPDHDVRTVAREGWAGLSNGELLKHAIDARFEVLITGDRNLQHQQNVAATGVAVIVLAARTNRIEDLLPLVPSVSDALAKITPGEVVEVSDS